MNILEEIQIDKGDTNETGADLIVKFLGYLVGAIIAPITVGLLLSNLGHILNNF